MDFWPTVKEAFIIAIDDDSERGWKKILGTA